MPGLATTMKIRKILLPCFGAIALISATLWVVSYGCVYYRGHDFFVNVYAGHFQFLYTDEPWTERPESEGYHMGWYSRGYHGLGVLWWPFGTIAKDYWTFHLPLWIPLSVSTLLFWYLYIPFRRYRFRLQRGLCLSCGYDLRASLDRCPECGTTTTSK